MTLPHAKLMRSIELLEAHVLPTIRKPTTETYESAHQQMYVEEALMSGLKKVVLSEAFSAITQTWNPRIGGDINDFQIKLAKFDGAFHWHHHEYEDELFLVIRGKLLMRLHDADGGDVFLNEGEYIIVPHGVEHCPTAEPTCDVVLLERNSTLNTGNVENEQTVRELARLDDLVSPGLLP